MFFAAIAIDATFEEVLRAYLLVRTRDAWGSTTLAIGLAVLAHVAVHFHNGIAVQPGHIAFVGCMIGYFLWRRDLVALSIAHAVSNFLILAPRAV